MEESSFLLTRLIALIELDEGTSYREQGKKKEISTHLLLFPPSVSLEFHRGEIPKKTEENGHVAEISNEAR